MSVNLMRPATAVLAAGMLTAGIAMLFAGRAETPVQAASLHTIEILETGFNPAVCTVNRNNDEVRWFNKTSSPVHILVPDVGGPGNPPRFDFGEVLPGQFSAQKLIITAVTDLTYIDNNRPERKGRIIAPISNTAQADCSPAPPTPTPTNTPTRTPTPTATPSSTPYAVPPRCIGVQGCGVAIDIAKDD
ncbi:MAG: hypothetical protein ACKVVT_19445 [Dehalococcoidia bacterium]